jgi:hypothetical protein
METKAPFHSVLNSGLRLLACVGLGAAVAQSLVEPASAQTCPNPPSPSISSSQPPADVCIPSGFPGNPIAFFDDYSWRAFIAMVWPAAQGQRGVPDTSKTVGTVSGPLVFETFKADWEVFQPDGHAPSPWSEFGGVPTNPCQADVTSPSFNDMILASITKFQNLGQAGFGKLVGPLVAQNKTYVRYITSFNQSEFNQILNGQWYLRDHLKNGVAFTDSSIDVKTSWIDMTNVQQPERFYTRKAWLMDLSTGRCSEMTVGLVGMHIVQKTESRPQWIWSSFEHIDNVPQTTPSNLGPTTFNDASGQAMPTANPIPFPPPETPPPPFNVIRVKPINASTLETNAAYRDALKGSVWANYQLVMTQWPLVAGNPKIPGSPPNTFPGTIDSSTSFANTSMETFEQRSVTTGCMNCHNFTRTGTDFLWALEINAFPVPPSTLAVSALGAPHAMALNAMPGTPSLADLKALLESATAPSGQ